jgi:hypothetical protein
MPTTTNFGWTTPADTDLVKDGAAAIRTALGGVDTSFVDLKGGTTGQVLAKNSGTDMDFVWNTPAVASGPAFYVYRTTSDQSITSATFTKVQLNAESFDTDNCFDSTTDYRFTPTKAGYYQLNASIYSAGASMSRIIGTFYKNGSQYTRFQDLNLSSTTIQNSGSTLMYFDGSTDYAELYVYLTGTTLVVGQDPTASSTLFSGVWIRS